MISILHIKGLIGDLKLRPLRWLEVLRLPSAARAWMLWFDKVR